MATILEDFILIAPFAEIEEVPDPGTSPEAPGGEDYDRDDDDDQDDFDDQAERKQDDRPQVGGYEFPDEPDPTV